MLKLNLIVVQESKLAECTNLNIPNYNVVRRDGTYNRTPPGGDEAFIHSSIPHETIELNTQLQLVAVRVQLQKFITVSNIYSPVSQLQNLQYWKIYAYNF